MSATPALSAPVKVGAWDLKHHVVLAPLTRLRADKDGVPAPYAAEYYAQRATDGGLLITEATFIAKEAGGIPGAPGIYSQAQIDAWKKVTDAVHAKGGRIVLQLWALGRVAFPQSVDKVVGPVDGTYTPMSFTGELEDPVPVAGMSEADIDRYVGHYGQAAKNAVAAGFDGVEVHGANGYLLDQFLQSVTNKRTDAYGGSPENRMRFPLRAVGAVVDAIGAERVGLRLSPFSEFQGMREADPLALFVPWARTVLDKYRLAYLHGVEGRVSGVFDRPESQDSLDPIREVVAAHAPTKFIAAGGFTAASAEAQVEKTGDLIAFGRYYISNPDIVARITGGHELTKWDRDTFYSPGTVGYTDYPVWKEVTVGAN